MVRVVIKFEDERGNWDCRVLQYDSEYLDFYLSHVKHTPGGYYCQIDVDGGYCFPFSALGEQEKDNILRVIKYELEGIVAGGDGWVLV